MGLMGPWVRCRGFVAPDCHLVADERVQITMGVADGGFSSSSRFIAPSVLPIVDEFSFVGIATRTTTCQL